MSSVTTDGDQSDLENRIGRVEMEPLFSHATETFLDNQIKYCRNPTAVQHP
jgi:hypothetical protein